MKQRSNLGQSLVEVLIGLAIAILIVGALINVVTSGIRNSQAAKSSSQATKYAQEGIEFIRSERDRNSWDEFKLARVSPTPWCLKNTDWPDAAANCIGEAGKISDTIFSREALIQRDKDSEGNEVENRVSVVVSVRWIDQARDPHESQLSTKFSDTGTWR